MRITSTANPVVRSVQALESARERRERDVFVIEGVRLVAEALTWAPHAQTVLYDPEALHRSASGSRILDTLRDWSDHAYEADERVLKAAAQTEHPGGVVAVVPLPPRGTLPPDWTGLGVILDGLSDPGNAGTILRAADAFGARFVWTTPTSVDLFAPKVVRAGMGAHFRLPMALRVTWTEISDLLPGITLVAAAGGEGVDVTKFRWPQSAALVIGGEAHGISDEARRLVHDYVHIQMRPGVESLNAAMAASIMLFETLGRSTGPGA